MKTPKTFAMDVCVKDLSNFMVEIAVTSKCRQQKSARTPIFCKQKLPSQKSIFILQFFFDNPKGEAFMYIMWKNQRFIFIIVGFFGSEI